MSTEKHFPNGFESWMETHYEVVEAMTTVLLRDDTSNVVTDRQEKQGHGGLYEFAEELTDEFELMNEGREWDGEFFDEIEKFLNDKIYD
jgi:hypothetical protein